MFTGMNSITYRNNVNIASGPKLYSFKDVQCHCTNNSCWIVITNQVYDVTKFLEEVSGHVDKVNEFKVIVAIALILSEILDISHLKKTLMYAHKPTIHLRKTICRYAT